MEQNPYAPPQVENSSPRKPYALSTLLMVVLLGGWLLIVVLDLLMPVVKAARDWLNW
jgi:hypothetical protein